MISPNRTAGLLEQFAQFVRGYSVMGDSPNGQVGTLLALVLAESSRQANRSLQSVALDKFVDDGEILGVPSRKTGTPETNLNFRSAVFRRHSYLILPATAQTENVHPAHHSPVFYDAHLFRPARVRQSG